MRTKFAKKFSRRNENRGIATILVVIVVVIVVIVAGVGIFYYTATITSTSTGLRSTTQTTSMSISVTITPPTSIRTAQSSVTASSKVSTASLSGITTYSGTYNFSVPEGPSGVRSLSNGSIQIYNTTQVASGSFTFFISASNESGSGTGQGTFTATTSGFCSGSTTFHYTFIIPDATTILGGNLTIFFSNPTPSMFSVQLACTGNMSGVDTTTNNPSQYLPTYPNELTVKSVPAVVNVHQSAGFSYYFNIV